MNTSTLRIVSIVQVRVDAFLKEIFDICKSSEEGLKTKSLWDTIATEFAICDSVEVAVRRRRNQRTSFAHLTTDIVHYIFGMVVEVDRVHDPDLPVRALDENREDLFRMRRVSSAWNEFLLSSPRYWQTIHIASPPQVITAALERSGSAPLCVYCFGSSPVERPEDLPKELRSSCARIRTLRSENSRIYPLLRWFVRDHRPALQTLQLARYSATIEDTVEPLGDLSSIRHLTAQWWQPPAHAAWLVGLKELVLFRSDEPDMELLQLLSACANLEDLAISDMGSRAIQEFPSSTLPITLPRLKSIRLYFISNGSAMKLTPKLITPQCHQRSLAIDQPLSPRKLVTVGSYRQRRAAPSNPSPHAFLSKADVEAVTAFHDLVQEYQRLFKGPPLTVTIKDPSEHIWWYLKSLHDQNIRTIEAHFPKQKLEAVGDLLKAIGALSVHIAPRPIADSTTDWPFKSLRSIEIHHADMDLGNFTNLIEEYLNKSSKRLPEEIVLISCNLTGMELAEAAERLAAIEITLRDVACTYHGLEGSLDQGVLID
ncbi:hypothetical protein FS837_007764 [Tulasnella sp. UAMH 9824]|nr:hypothetical protein FS837_007764 [Tulasnella sp. UAMH 9824]